MEDVKVIEAFLRQKLNGDGSGDGSSYGESFGYGFGYGFSYGYGYGSGYGDGSGDGSGDCYGDCYGDGLKEYNGQLVWYIDDVPTLIDSVHGDHARGFIINRDLTISPCYIARVENSFAHGDTLRQAVRDAVAKEMEKAPLEERIARFVAEYPDPDASVPFRTLYDWHHILTGSCMMGRDQFTREHDLDTDADYTPRYFIGITSNAYGKEAIKALADAYGITFD